MPLFEDHFISAHRGASGTFPENTFLAFEAAARAGVCGAYGGTLYHQVAMEPGDAGADHLSNPPSLLRHSPHTRALGTAPCIFFQQSRQYM